MRDTFNVLDEAWIPVVNGSGGREMLGIREVLRRAPELQSVSDPSPLVEFGLCRLLTVFLMDALRPERLSSLRKLLRAGLFDMQKIEAYITQCETEGASFDLLDEKRPFLQVAYDAKWDKEPIPIGKLDCTIPSGNNHTHFDHRRGDAISMSYAEAARLLPTAYVFCTIGGRNYYPGINGTPPYYMLIQGGNLFETLVLNLGILEEIDDFDSIPVLWRNTDPFEADKLQTVSYLFAMLFPARCIHLIADSGEIKRMYYQPGIKLEIAENWTDPAVTYRSTEKGRSSLCPNREKAIWRNLRELIDIHAGGAQVLRQYEELLPDNCCAELSLYGAQTDQASYNAVLRHDLHVPMAVAADSERLDTLKSSISAAENAAYGLRVSLAGTEKNPGVLPKEGASGAVQMFYELCESRFWTFCETELASENADLKECYQRWCRDIAQFAKTAWEEAMKRYRLSGRELAKAEADQRTLRFRLWQNEEGGKR